MLLIHKAHRFAVGKENNLQDTIKAETIEYAILFIYQYVMLTCLHPRCAPQFRRELGCL